MVFNILSLICFPFIEIPFEVTVFTGDVQNGGTDAAISMCVFGASGYTPDIILEKNEDRFERGREDLIKVSDDYILCLFSVVKIYDWLFEGYVNILIAFQL